MEYISHTISDKEAKRLTAIEARANNAEITFRKFLWKLNELGLVVKYKETGVNRDIEYLTEHMTKINLIKDPGYDKIILNIEYKDR